ncbi:phosphatidate cytidylyltransferase [Terribacillus saccharophilus]|uniref:Phosphatidate cytidylyltransferase n=1 Tax=Terribacillus saccharophilus TaxID=361277 RepID=A0AAX2ECP0_9BACI|nr:phosphatidate cytidylyltransferase [Terribacillus saccharophilus]
MKQRLITAIIAGIFFMIFVLLGGAWFEAFIYLIATIAFIELLRMRKIAKYKVPSVVSVLLLWGLLAPDLGMINKMFDLHINKTDILLFSVILLLSYTVLAKNRFTFEDAGFLLITVVYVGFGFLYFIITRNAPDEIIGGHTVSGLSKFIFVLVVIWATDSGAYFFGKAFGKRKLWPTISPNKTIEGGIGGLVLGCVAGIVFQFISPVSSSILIVAGVCILIALFGQLGDMVESAFKRHYLVKDSGKILPGHGGILDRFDSMIFVFPILHLIQFI